MKRKLGRGGYIIAEHDTGDFLVITDREDGQQVSFSFNEIEDMAQMVADIKRVANK
jgi:hypothetical protein